jgi:hypothetical protein
MRTGDRRAGETDEKHRLARENGGKQRARREKAVGNGVAGENYDRHH